MLNYTRSSIDDTLVFIKRLIFVFDLLIQFIYIGYLVFRMLSNMGLLIANISLITLSVIYLLYFLLTRQEFYTKEDIKKRKSVSWIFKILKRIINLTVITMAIITLVDKTSEIDNITLLFTILMICGFMFSLLFDIIKYLIDCKYQLICDALKYDAYNMRKQHRLLTQAIDHLTKDSISDLDLDVDKKQIDKLNIVRTNSILRRKRKKNFMKNKNNA